MFVCYLLVLLWLVLFKSSSDIISVLADYQTRSVNLVPFAYYSLGDVVLNVLAFVPLGLLLGVNLKRVGFWPKFAFVCGLTAAVETAQFIFAIGSSDITDVIANSFGGLLGLALHKAGDRYVDTKKLDWFLVVVIAAALIAFFLFRTLVLKVRY
jgi:glycopeptide antibiotics resistance protein